MQLSDLFQTTFNADGNSFESCFIYGEAPASCRLYRKVKVYSKTLDLIQSAAVKKPIGMNTTSLFCPSNWLSSELIQTQNDGLSRIEISYMADDETAEQEFFKDTFEMQAKIEISRVKFVLNRYNKLCYRLSLQDLLETFEFMAKQRQLFILQPNMCAMIYTRNPKRGQYTGYLYDIPARTKFDYQQFLLKNALPGPGSRIRCILQPTGINGKLEQKWFDKQFDKCQIPGFVYQNRSVSDLQKPKGWTKKVLTDDQLSGLQLTEIKMSACKAKPLETPSEKEERICREEKMRLKRKRSRPLDRIAMM